MTYLEKALQEKDKVVNVLIEGTCPGRVVHGAPIHGNDNGCLIGRIAIEPCVECWNREMPETEGIATGAARPRNDSFPGLPGQLKSSSVDALIQLLDGQIEHWEAMRNSYAYEATVAQGRKPGDCHDQCEHWSRNDTVFIGAAVNRGDCHDQCAHWSRNDEKISMLVGKLKACAALVDQYKALSLELEKYREGCGYGRCD